MFEGPNIFVIFFRNFVKFLILPITKCRRQNAGNEALVRTSRSSRKWWSTVLSVVDYQAANQQSYSNARTAQEQVTHGRLSTGFPPKKILSRDRGNTWQAFHS